MYDIRGAHSQYDQRGVELISTQIEVLSQTEYHGIGDVYAKCVTYVPSCHHTLGQGSPVKEGKQSYRTQNRKNAPIDLANQLSLADVVAFSLHWRLVVMILHVKVQ